MKKALPSMSIAMVQFMKSGKTLLWLMHISLQAI